MSTLKLIEKMKSDFLINNFEEQKLWFDADEFKLTYDVVESDHIGKQPLMRLHSDPLKAIEFATKEGFEIYTKYYVLTHLKFPFDKYYEDMYKESLNLYCANQSAN